MLPKAIIDTSTLIELYDLNLIPKLSILMDEVLYPSEVQQEFARKGKARFKKTILQSFLQMCTIADQARITLLKQMNVDPGEAEVIAQATERNIPIVLIDDKRAQKYAARHGLIVRDRDWVVNELSRLGII